MNSYPLPALPGWLPEAERIIKNHQEGCCCGACAAWSGARVAVTPAAIYRPVHGGWPDTSHNEAQVDLNKASDDQRLLRTLSLYKPLDRDEVALVLQALGA